MILYLPVLWTLLRFSTFYVYNSDPCLRVVGVTRPPYDVFTPLAVVGVSYWRVVELLFVVQYDVVDREKEKYHCA